MQLLIDTHAFIWYATDDKKLSPKALSLIESNNEILLSIASIWEMAVKVNIGKLKFMKPFSELITEQIKINDYKILNLKTEYLFLLSELRLFHRDPFDRLIISQSLVEKIAVVSIDVIFDNYGVKRIW